MSFLLNDLTTELYRICLLRFWLGRNRDFIMTSFLQDLHPSGPSSRGINDFDLNGKIAYTSLSRGDRPREQTPNPNNQRERFLYKFLKDTGRRDGLRNCLQAKLEAYIGELDPKTAKLQTHHFMRELYNAERARQIGYHEAQVPEPQPFEKELAPSQAQNDELTTAIKAKKAVITATMNEQRAKKAAEQREMAKAAAAERTAQMTVKERKKKEHDNHRSKEGIKRKRDNLKRNRREHREAVAVAVAVATAELQESWAAKNFLSLPNTDGVDGNVGAVEAEEMSCDNDSTA